MSELRHAQQHARPWTRVGTAAVLAAAALGVSVWAQTARPPARPSARPAAVQTAPPATPAPTAAPGNHAADRAAGTDGVPTSQPQATANVPEPKQAGGEPDGIVQVANLVYAGTKSSQCFSDHFLVQAEQVSTLSTSRRFHAVKLGSDELFEFPLVIMTGEGAFQLTDGERQNLREHIERGGFLLASAGCSSSEWDQSFRAEMTAIFPNNPLEIIGMDHAVFHTVYDILELTGLHGPPRPLEGASFNGRLGVLYSRDGLNDTSHATGCCCCGGNEITNAVEVNVNILAYAVTH